MTNEISAARMNGMLFLFVGLIFFVKVLMTPAQAQIAFDELHHGSHVNLLSLISLLIGGVLCALTVSIFLMFFKFFRKNFGSHIKKKSLELSIVFGCLFLIFPILFFIPISFLEAQLALSISLVLRLALIYGALIAHCVLLEFSLKEMLSDRVKLFLKICSALMALCFAASVAIALQFRIYDLWSSFNLSIVEFLILFCMIPYSAFLTFVFYNFPKRLAAQGYQREQLQDVTGPPMFVSVRKSTWEKFEERRG